jgi:hypothetical protein
MNKWIAFLTSLITLASLEVSAANSNFIQCDGNDFRYDFNFNPDENGKYNGKFFYTENGAPQVTDFNFLIRSYPREVIAYWPGPTDSPASCTLLKKIFEPRNVNKIFKVSCLNFNGYEFFMKCRAIR